jgi:hypothetical protein
MFDIATNTTPPTYHPQHTTNRRRKKVCSTNHPQPTTTLSYLILHTRTLHHNKKTNGHLPTGSDVTTLGGRPMFDTNNHSKTNTTKNTQTEPTTYIRVKLTHANNSKPPTNQNTTDQHGIVQCTVHDGP